MLLKFLKSEKYVLIVVIGLGLATIFTPKNPVAVKHESVSMQQDSIDIIEEEDIISLKHNIND